MNTIQFAAQMAEYAKCRNMKVGLTTGAFDLLHVNHIRFLRDAVGLCDVFLVAVNTDRSTRAYKGPSRPIVPESERREVIASIKGVHFAFLFDDDDPCRIIETIRPDVFFKGMDRLGQVLPEQGTLDRLGVELQFIGPVKDHSTTDIVLRCAQVGNLVLDQVEADRSSDRQPACPLPAGF